MFYDVFIEQSYTIHGTVVVFMSRKSHPNTKRHWEIKSLLAAANSAISCNQIMLQYTWFMANSQLQTSIPTCLFIHLSTDHALHPIKTFHKELTAFQMELRKTSVAVVFWTVSQKNCSIVIGRTVLPTGFLPKWCFDVWMASKSFKWAPKGKGVPSGMSKLPACMTSWWTWMMNLSAGPFFGFQGFLRSISVQGALHRRSSSPTSLLVVPCHTEYDMLGVVLEELLPRPRNILFSNGMFAGWNEVLFANPFRNRCWIPREELRHRSCSRWCLSRRAQHVDVNTPSAREHSGISPYKMPQSLSSPSQSVHHLVFSSCLLQKLGDSSSWLHSRSVQPTCFQVFARMEMESLWWSKCCSLLACEGTPETKHLWSHSRGGNFALSKAQDR